MEINPSHCKSVKQQSRLSKDLGFNSLVVNGHAKCNVIHRCNRLSEHNCYFASEFSRRRYDLFRWWLLRWRRWTGPWTIRCNMCWNNAAVLSLIAVSWSSWKLTREFLMPGLCIQNTDAFLTTAAVQCQKNILCQMLFYVNLYINFLLYSFLNLSLPRK